MAESDPILGSDIIGDLSAQIAQVNQLVAGLDRAKASMSVVASGAGNNARGPTPSDTASLNSHTQAVKDSTAAAKAQFVIDGQLSEAQKKAIDLQNKLIEAKRKYRAESKQVLASQVSEEGSVMRMQASYNELIQKYDKVNAVTRSQMLPAIQKLKVELEAAKQATGRFTGAVGDYHDNTIKYAKGLRGLGGIGRLAARVFGFDQESFLALQEAGKALKEYHHTQEGLKAATEGNTVATEANTVATEANIAVKEEESTVSSMALGLWGLLAVAIIGASVAIYEWYHKSEDAVSSWERQSETMKKFKEEIIKLNEEIDKNIIALGKQQGKLTDFQAAQKQARADEIKDTGNVLKDTAEEQKKIIEAHSGFLHKAGLAMKNLLFSSTGADAFAEDAKEQADEITRLHEKASEVLDKQQEKRDSDLAIVADKKHTEDINLEFERLQSKILLQKEETKNKKEQLDLQLQYDLNANSEAKKDDIVKAQDGLTIRKKYLHDLESLEEDHMAAMISMADQLARYKQGQGTSRDASKTGLLNSDTSEKSIKSKMRDQEIEDLKKDIALEHRWGLSEVEDKLKLAQLEYDKRKELRDQELADIKKMMDESVVFVQDAIKRKNDLTKQNLDNDLEMRQRNIIQQQQLASEGSANTLAFEKAAAAKDELAKQQLAIKEKKQADAIALGKIFLNLFEAYSAKDPDGAAMKAMQQTFVAKGLSSTISGQYFEGTENVGQDLAGNKVHNGRDGYVVAVDGSERILTGDQNRMIGDMSNDQLARVAMNYQLGMPTMFQFKSLENKFDEVIEVIKNRPVGSTNLDNMGFLVKEEVKNGIRHSRKKQIFNNYI